MAKRVVVSGAEQAAARYVVKNNTAKGRATKSSVSRIANAKTYRSAITGRYAKSTGSSAK